MNKSNFEHAFALLANNQIVAVYPKTNSFFCKVWMPVGRLSANGSRHLLAPACLVYRYRKMVDVTRHGGLCRTRKPSRRLGWIFRKFGGSRIIEMFEPCHASRIGSNWTISYKVSMSGCWKECGENADASWWLGACHGQVIIYLSLFSDSALPRPPLLHDNTLCTSCIINLSSSARASRFGDSQKHRISRFIVELHDSIHLSRV
jgi:hypothetical protein